MILVCFFAVFMILVYHLPRWTIFCGADARFDEEATLTDQDQLPFT